MIYFYEEYEMTIKWKNLVLGAMFMVPLFNLFAGEEDPFMWLEDVTSEKALEWVGKQNAESKPKLEKVTGFEEVKKTALEVLNSKERIPYATKYGAYYYNFWRDAKHIRGIYRRTTLEEYRKETPKWETVFDVDQIAADEKENWVYKGAQFLYPDYERCLLNLSRGGADATVVREFDVTTKSFVKDGFTLPEAKSNISWRDKDSVYVGTDFGQGSLTASGYPRIVKLWKRGTALADAKTLFEADAKHVFAYAGRINRKEKSIDFLVDATTFFSNETYILEGDKKTKLDIPADADFEGYINGQILVLLKSDWNVDGKSFKQGSLLIQPADAVLAGKKDYRVIFEPTERTSLSSASTTRNLILLSILDNVTSKLTALKPDENGSWKEVSIPTEPKGMISVMGTNEDSDVFFMNFQSHLTPSTLYLVDGGAGTTEKLKSLPHFFDSKPFQTDQFEAVSKDGTKIPYFVLHRKDWKMNGQNPTLLYGYGGFEVSMTPRYSAVTGKAWLEKGGVYVVANIRGGGEFGPKWHQAALLKKRMRSFEDFIAVGEDLIKRNITAKSKLGIQGGSNGGLLVGAAFTMRPDLFKAVVCQVPLLDMKRYTKLLAGASWAAEYGDPDDPDMWEYIKTYSPYHNLKEGVSYPRVFFMTSTRDDRVHPAHARKMVARMKDMGYPVLYYENTEGGHAGAANNEQRAYMVAVTYAYLYDELMK